MLEPKTWGDHGTILILLLMWQVKVTIIIAETQKQQRFRHDSSLKDADFVLVFCGGNHYVPAGEERSGAEIGPWGEQTSVPTGAEIGFNRFTLLFLHDTTFLGPVLG